MPSDNDIVLVDSSSENEEDQDDSLREIKKFKPNPNESNRLNNGNFSTVPFNAVSSSSSSSDNEQEEEEEPEETNGNQILFNIDDGYDSEGLTKESSRTPIGNNISDITDTPTNTNQLDGNHDGKSLPFTSSSSSSSDDDNDSDDDDDDDLESDFAFEEIPPSIIMETRKYLKQNGTMKFLEKYLPTAATIENIIKLILQLGFVPKRKSSSNINGDENNDIMEYIKILNHAIIKVKSIRERREDITTIKDVLKLIKNCENIMVITGAGISTSLGIPDFRSSQGFYSMVQHLGLSDPQEVFDLDIFNNDPKLFYSIAHMILPPNHIFSPLHSFIKLLQDKQKLLRNYTQNIDNLESYAGISKEKLIQCHGSFATASCITCGYQVDGEIIFPEIKNKQIPYCPKCNEIKQSILKSKKKKQRKNYDDYDDDEDEETYFHESFGVMKPDITFFGEQLPENFKIAINQDINKVDLVIVIGTSLKVAPVADIVGKIPELVPQILLNKDPINHCQFDVSLLGYCDDIASYIANELGESWDLPHPDYNKIRGGGEGGKKKGENLLIQLIDPTLREYLISNKSTTNNEKQGVVEGDEEQKEEPKKEELEIEEEKEAPIDKS